MRVASEWKDYELIDLASGEALERWGDYTLIRPDPTAIWAGDLENNLDKADARYIRTNSKSGEWTFNKPLPASWNIRYKGLTFKVKPTGFKHTGIFPEQAVNWDYCATRIPEALAAYKGDISVLNLFAYTGGATLACLKAGAKVCHLDAVKGMVDWAKENAKLSGLEKASVRWIADDAQKFLNREIKRGNRYDAIILDPPSYGRGTGGEMWKLETSLYDLTLKCAEVLSDKPLFIILNSYTTGLSAAAVEYLLNVALEKNLKLKKFKITVKAEEIGLPVAKTKLIAPRGSTALVEFNRI